MTPEEFSVHVFAQEVAPTRASKRSLRGRVGHIDRAHEDRSDKAIGVIEVMAR
jgi:hypothetical protein